MIILETEKLTKIYKQGNNEIRALDNVNIKITKGEFVAIVGTSGSGKSTLLNMLGGLDKPTDGKVTVDGKLLCDLCDEELTIFRRREIGFIFQNYNLIPILNVYENIVFPIELDGMKIDRNYVEEIVKILGLSNKLKNMANNLSGGQQQRVAIARALAKNPKILLCDEPTGALDYNTGKSILKLLQDTCRSMNMTVIIITHNLALTPMGDKVIKVKNGKISSITINENPIPVERIEW